MAERFNPILNDQASLDDALERWQQAGVITPEQAATIREMEAAASLAARPARTDITPSTLITYIGGFLVVVASIVFVALGWEDMGDLQRLF